MTLLPLNLTCNRHSAQPRWYISVMSHMQLSRNLSPSNLSSIHSCYSLILCAHECYLTSHSFRAHVSSHDSVSPFLTQLSVPIPIPHAIFALSLTRSRCLALLIARAISIALSLSLTGRGQTRWSTRRHGLVFDRSWQSTIDPTTIWCTPIVNQGQRVRSAVKVSKM